MSASVNPQRLLSLFEGMVDIYSPSGKEEQITQFLSEFLAPHGLKVLCQPVDNQRENLLIKTGAAEPSILFLGHVDTVPAYDIDRYGFELRDGWCHGLGTADMKGGCAAMIEGLLVARERGGLRDDVMIALVVGEEETGDGTQALLQAYHFKQALVAEPTDLRPCLGHYGYVEMVVRAFGSRRHAAMSGRDTNATRALLRLLLRLEDHVEAEDPRVVLNIRDLHSSESGFAVPDRCAAALDLHVPPEQSTADYAAQLQAFAERQLSGSGASRHEIEFPTLADGYRVDASLDLAHRAVEALAAQGVARPQDAFRSHSDANLLHAAGCPAIVLGPGQLAKAHTVDEAVEQEKVLTAAAIYAHLLGC